MNPSDTSSPGNRVVVLESVVGPDGTTKFIDQIVTHASGAVTYLFFSWPRALFGRYDVFHVHWPEFLVRGHGPLKGALRALLGFALLARLSLSRTPVVRTVHNLEPHARGGRVEAAFVRRLAGRVTQTVSLNRSTPAWPGVPNALIPHGDYVERFAGLPREAAAARRAVVFGRLEHYKGVDLMIDALADQPGLDLRVHVAGSPADGIAEMLQSAAALDPRIELTLETLSDAELVRAVTAAELVILPYREMHNSGVALVALSLDRPVVIPAGEVASELTDEVGEAWIRTFDGAFDGTALRQAVEWNDARHREDRVHFVGRDWVSVAGQYERVLAAAARAKYHPRREVRDGAQ